MYICVNPLEKQTELRREDISRGSSWLNCIKYFLHVSLTFFCNEERQKQSEPTIWLQPAAPVQFFRWIPIRWALGRFQHGTHPSSCRSKSKVGQKANCQTMPTMKIGLEVISSWVCCSAPNGDLRVQISIDFCQSFDLCLGTLLCKLQILVTAIVCHSALSSMYLSTSILQNQLGDPVVNAKAWIWILTMRRWCSSAWREGTGHQSGPRQVSNMGTSQICDRKF